MRFQRVADAAVVILAVAALGSLWDRWGRSRAAPLVSTIAVPVDSLVSRVRVRTVDTSLAIGGSTGRHTLVFVFRSDCPACALQRPRWLALAAEPTARRGGVLALTAENLGSPAVSGYLSGVAGVVGAPEDSEKAFRALAVSGVPATVLIDSGGKIRFHKVGVMSPTEEQGLLESLRALP